MQLPARTVTRYSEYRNPPWDERKYKRPPIYWHIMAARLAFVVVFQNLVGFVMMAVEWLIPDMSHKLRDEIRREAYLTSELIIKQETLRARGMSPHPDSGDFLSTEKEHLGHTQPSNHVRFRNHGAAGDDTSQVSIHMV
uniref:Anoctamin n=1 Tax=Timema poppense TaxID=170557 RepID=A0A7R9DH26_TIMPO|nr:unnamed protein product [Timema poppensis]